MAKHKLDEEVEDILQHYGIKGMRWDIKRTPEQIDADARAGVDAVGEALLDAGDVIAGRNSITEELGDVLSVLFGGEGNLEKESAQLQRVTKRKLKAFSKDVKKRGIKMLERMFGTAAEQRAKDKAKKQDFINGMKAGSAAYNKKSKLNKDSFSNPNSKPKKSKKKTGLGSVNKKKLRNR